METLCYTLADLPISIEVPFAMEISPESKPFLQRSGKDPVERIQLIPVDALPPASECGIWHQDRYYVTTDRENTVYIRSMPGKPPYAMLDYGKPGCIPIFYLRNTKDMVRESRYLINMLGLESLLLRHNCAILHASFIRWQGKGILFSAPSGTGKSTQASLWEEYLGAKILNGDRAGIRYVNGEWTAYGLPYAGSSHIFHNESARICAIVILRKGPENRIWLMTRMEALQNLLPELSAHIWSPAFMNQVLDIAGGLLRKIPVYCLECRPDYGAVQLLHDTLMKEEIL